MITFYFIACFLLSGFYFNLVGSNLKAWLQSPEMSTNKTNNHLLKISILIAARNEEKALEKCLKSLTNQNYPKELYELILLDDFSEDKTIEIAAQFKNIKTIQLSKILKKSFKTKSNKKRAITLGIKQAKHPIIITTDADCFYGENWLKAMTQAFSSKQAKMITAPVVFNQKKSFLSKFLALDLLSLMGVTCGSIQQGKPTMVNGANLMYEKSVFLELNGFHGNENIASGDDIFLMQKINSTYPNAIHFLKNKDAICFTDAPSNFIDFVNQRIRWTAKSVNQIDKSITFKLLLNYLFNVSTFLNIFVFSFFKIIFFKIGILMFFSKTFIDILFFNNVLLFFKRKKLLSYILPIEILHILYISLLGILSLYGKYSWKGRKN